LLRRRREDGDTPHFLADVDSFIRRGQATGALLDGDEDRWASQSLLDYWANILYKTGQALPETTLAEFDPSLAPELADDLCPYLGLDAFQESDREIFFGRRRLIEHLIAHLKTDRLLAVVGPSGSGKSSVARAGLLPALQQGALPGSQTWRYYPPLAPGSTPLANLARLVRPSGANMAEWTRRQVAQFLQEPAHLTRLINEAGASPAVLVVDQFEELFTLNDDDRTRQAFVENILNLTEATEARHTAILTLRTDFESHMARLPLLQTRFEQAQVRLTTLNAGELREAIEEPAKLIGLKFEEGLVDQLIQDILGEPAALPLLQFTLLKLWEMRERNRVTWESYRRLGGGRLALARSADAFYEGLMLEEQVTAKRILLRMVRPGEGLEVTSNRIRRETLYQTHEARDRIDRVLGKLIQARLVRLTEGDTPADAQVEVAHEALVRNWPRLVAWLEDERVALRQRLRLTSAAEQWQAVGEDPAALWRGSLLAEALRYDDLNELEMKFVQVSQAAVEEAEREKETARQRELQQAQALADEQRLRAEEQAHANAQLRRRAQYLSVALAAALVMAIAAIFFGWQAQQNAREAAANAAMALAERDSRSIAEAGVATATDLAGAYRFTAVAERSTAEAVAAIATTALDPEVRATTAQRDLQTAQAEAATAAAQAISSAGPLAAPAFETATAAAQRLQVAQQIATAAAAEYEATATPAAIATAIAASKQELARAGLTGQGVKIVIADTGIDLDDAYLAQRVVAGQNFADDDAENYHDGNSHGTLLARIIVGDATGEEPDRGWAPEAELYIAKVLSDSGAGSLNDIVAAVHWAIEQKADILVLALGSNRCTTNDALSQAADAAVEAGLVVVVAAGVEGPEPGTISSPGCAELPITVGYVTDSNEVGSFSSRGPTFDGRVKPDLVFYSSNLVGASSGATAQVAGAIALLLQAKPDLTPAEVKDILKETAKDLGFGPNVQGAGLMDIEAALARIEP
jgi:hypothetical protein